ncbi:HTTM domain-containing protein [Pollutibacter soli]|uniref:HTTM domain-containing protein n=1 Tax=Pollutibacter soli TaxID=3034157 RepID=UPI0030138943
MMVTNHPTSFWNRPVPIAPLVSFRITFGVLMFFSLLRFWWRGWVTTVYIEPKFHFTYTGFEWVKPLGETGMHLLFLIIILSTVLITIGLFYRLSMIVFFIGFTYVELIDITTYLNHYYFISLVAFIMIWLPAAADFSVDCKRNPSSRRLLVPAWVVGSIRFQMAVVYIFAGLAKLNSDWLIHAEPMRTWLPAKSHLPIIGKLMYSEWIAYLFSWFGAVYDLCIVFFLLNKKTRKSAYVFVLIFHGATAIFFPAIGMFPYVMIVSSLIFFSGEFHDKMLSKIPAYRNRLSEENKAVYHYRFPELLKVGAIVYILIQLLVPLRFIAYPGNLFWHEQGYRFSWRVMLMEKAGTAYFTVKDKTNGSAYEVDNKSFLTPLQEKMMSTQPDMMVKYAHFLASEYSKRGIKHPQVYAEVYVALNGRPSRPFIDPKVDLNEQETGWHQYKWVLPFKD